MSRLSRSWFAREATVVAPDLLNKVLCVGVGDRAVSGRIVETEAYMPDDPASHSYRGETQRNAVMFGPPGHLYVYLSYGIHRCANVVSGEVGSGQAVLIRAVEPLEGVDTMRLRRRRPDRELADGPGKLCQALGIDLCDDGVDLTESGRILVVDDGRPPPCEPVAGPRVGISKAVDLPWSFRIPRSDRDG